MAAKQGSRWGSLLSGAVAGLESRLDTILAEDGEASARSRAADKALQEAKAARATADSGNLAIPTNIADASRSSSRARVNDRLQERLAKAVANQKEGTLASSKPSSPSGSPAIGSVTPRTSLDSKRSADVSRVSLDGLQQGYTVATDDIGNEDGITAIPAPESSKGLSMSELPINPARHSHESGSRPSIERSDVPPEQAEEADGDALPLPKTNAELEAEIIQMRADYTEAEKQRQEEMHGNFERIDALQAKLQYLAKETVAAAKEANAAAPLGSLEQKLAEKDERVALLMEEGEKLSKGEMRHLLNIKKLRAKMNDDEKSAAELRQRLAKVEQSEVELRRKLRRAEQSEKQSVEQLKQLLTLTKEGESLREELQASKATVGLLRKQLLDTEERMEEAERKVQNVAAQAESKKIADLQDELSEARTEKALATDRANAEIKRITEATAGQMEHSRSLETELRNEIFNLENRMETLRFRAEEASSDNVGDSQAKLLRQIETLQTQYSLAAENWRTIESSLNAHVTAIEKERDEATRRESDVRKKARDHTSRSRRLEDELETLHEQSRCTMEDLQAQREANAKLQARVEAAEKGLEEATGDSDRQRRIWEAEVSRLEDEKARFTARSTKGGLGINTQQQQHRTLSVESPVSSHRKPSTPDQYGTSSLHSRHAIKRVSSHDLYGLATDRPSRNSSALPTPLLQPGQLATYPRRSVTPEYSFSPSVSRQDSSASFAHLNGHASSPMPPTPSIHTADVDATEYPFDRDDAPGSSSPPAHSHTINDVLSASTVHTGPSVQLVERMSSSIRRLESEKASHKDEVARLLAQRDEARDEVVRLMREVEGTRTTGRKVESVEADLVEVRKRYDACLEMLGEREEQVAELRGDVLELKRIYRDLAETMGK